MSFFPSGPVTPPGSLKSSDDPSFGRFFGGGTGGTPRFGSPTSARSSLSTSASMPSSHTAGSEVVVVVRA
eukprot:7383150-Prymnesium_polylepis.2